MSRFSRAIRVLKGTGHPLFERMAETGRAIPMALDIRGGVLDLADGTPRKRIHRAMWRLCHSRRYLEACAAEGAMRHDLSGWPVEPVSPGHQAHARAELERRMGHPGLVVLPGSPAVLEAP